MSIKSGIYKITLISDGRMYIGSAFDIEARWKWHRGSTVQLIGKMIKKHGVDSFLFSILEECEATKEVLESREQWYLDTIQPFPWNNNKGFNLVPNAYSCLGIKRSDDTKKKMREVWHASRDVTYYDTLSARMTGDSNPAKRQEVRDKISKSMIGKTWKEDSARIESHSKRMKEISIFSSPAHKQKMRDIHTGSKRSDLSKKKMSDRQQRIYEVISPDGDIIILSSKELKQFCLDQNLGYPNLQGTSKNGKTYKGWKCQLKPC